MRELRPDEVEVHPWCSQYKRPRCVGGQHVAKSCAGVMVVHHATQVATYSCDERSQYRNRLVALASLRELVHMRETRTAALDESRVTAHALRTALAWRASDDTGDAVAYAEVLAAEIVRLAGARNA